MVNENDAVGMLSEMLALKSGYSPKKAEEIKMAATLHDIGKSKIPKSLLYKSGKLSPEEFEVIKMHTKYGEKILTPMQGNFGKMAQEIALMHHEKFDGSGYWGFKSSDLPKYVGIVTICDISCALVYERCYKPPWTLTETLKYINTQAGKQFCPKLTDDFISLVCSSNSATAILLPKNHMEVTNE